MWKYGKRVDPCTKSVPRRVGKGGSGLFSPLTHMRDQRLGGRDGKGPSLGLEIGTARDTEPIGRLKGPRLPYSIAGPGLRGEG